MYFLPFFFFALQQEVNISSTMHAPSQETLVLFPSLVVKGGNGKDREQGQGEEEGGTLLQNSHCRPWLQEAKHPLLAALDRTFCQRGTLLDTVSVTSKIGEKLLD